MPVGAGQWRWLADPRREEPAQPPRDYASVSSFNAVGTGSLSWYPFAAVAKGDRGRAIGIDMGRPAFFRVGFAAGTGELYVAYDLALTKEKPSAEFSFCTFPFEGTWGFRGAVAKFYDLFPDYFRSRTPQQGVWMPFHQIDKVEGWQDFGFKFKEGNDQTQWDNAHDILTFRYTEPLTWWMTLPKGSPRTMDAALAQAKHLASKGDKSPGAAHQRLSRPVGAIRRDHPEPPVVRRGGLEHELLPGHQRRRDRFPEQVERGPQGQALRQGPQGRPGWRVYRFQRRLRDRGPGFPQGTFRRLPDRFDLLIRRFPAGSFSRADCRRVCPRQSPATCTAWAN